MIPYKEKETKIFYACGVDWQHELGEASDLEGRMPLYSSIEELKENQKCWKECGIVKIKLTIDSWVEEQQLFESQKNE
jgi:hypothetical protein